jgi:hypothetical protein
MPDLTFLESQFKESLLGALNNFVGLFEHREDRAYAVLDAIIEELDDDQKTVILILAAQLGDGGDTELE